MKNRAYTDLLASLPYEEVFLTGFFFEHSLRFENSFNSRCKATKTLRVGIPLAESLTIDYFGTKTNGSDILIS